MTYNDAISFLYNLQLFGARLGLENTLRLAELCGNPHEKLRFIHVAGTNGKGSTCAMLESIYRTAGLRVGLFTSPHLVKFGERIQVNRELISEGDIARLTDEMKSLLEKFPPDAHPTFFEVVTVMALRYFVEQKCELVIWETGLGGRLDATNIVTPLASVITNIQFDHQVWLGDTLARIAAEKAGIIKPRVPAITAVDNPEAFHVLYQTALVNEAPFFLISATADYPLMHGLNLPLLGHHQVINAAVAAYTVRAIADRIPVSDATIRTGLQTVQWPGRLQLLEIPISTLPGRRRREESLTNSGLDDISTAPQSSPEQTDFSPPPVGEGERSLYPLSSIIHPQRVVLDGAHNIGGAESLRAALQTYFPEQNPTLILGILRDKDCAKICEILAPLSSRILLTLVESQRTATPQELVPACRSANPYAEIAETKSLAQALELAGDDPLVVVAGSLYLIGEAMELLKLVSDKATSERTLNEWTAKPSKA